MLSDPREFELPSVGYVDFEDSETGEIIEINCNSRRFRENYRELNLKYARQRDQAFKQSGLDYMHLRTDESYIEALRHLFHKRTRR